MHISLYHRSLELFSVFSVALLLHCRGIVHFLIELVEKTGLPPPSVCFRRNKRGTLWYDLCYNITVVVCVIPYECVSVCSMSIAVIGNALTFVSFFLQVSLFFCPF